MKGKPGSLAPLTSPALACLFYIMNESKLSFEERILRLSKSPPS